MFLIVGSGSQGIGRHMANMDTYSIQGDNHIKISYFCSLGGIFKGGQLQLKTGADVHTIELDIGNAVLLPFYIVTGKA